MPSKKSSKSSSKKKAVKKAPAKKKPVAKKVVKKAAKKPAAKKKKSVAKKPVAKKKSAKKKKISAKKKLVAMKTIAEARKEVLEAVDQAPVITVTEKRIKHKHKPVEVHRRIVFVGTCANCDHVPMRVSKLLALMSLIVFVLSSIIIAQGPLPNIPTIQFANDDAPILIQYDGR